ncbi:hypothetical protein H4R18_002151 [Coemansia javaensis]|uniref:Uncharacterized protein n=1 Tax=Coemansia javaensis TaxID=2761396 RepID=A0A9W8HCR4_9FUNG|nr:hypothetical protein H4R18_002151 [Coemansia javaensis]
MQLRDLPDDVLRLVLEASLDRRPLAKFTIKANLPLLAVCRRGGGSDDGHASSAADEPNDAKVTTDLDLVVAAGCVQAVKQVRIFVYCKASPLPGLDAAVRLMRAAAGVWRGARQLEISTFPTNHALARRVNAADHQDGIRQTIASLAATMPGIRRVSFKGYIASPVVRELDGQLAVLYSGQLEGLLSQHPIAVPPDHTFRHLGSVSIWYDGSGPSYQHPGVDPTRLVSLELESWPPNNTWAPFSADGDSGAIEFPSLRRLTATSCTNHVVDSVEARHRDSHPWKLHFPRLNRLHVECRQSACPLLEYAVLPPRMGEISIEATEPVLVRVAEMRLPTSTRLKVAVSRYADGSPAALAAANRILESAQESKEVALRVRDEALPVLPESITCTSLTALSIFSDTSVDAMLGLIHMLPGLARLAVLSLTLSNAQEDISVPGPDEPCLAEPLGPKLKEMVLGASSNGPAPEALVPVAKYLLLRIPTLTRLCSAAIPGGPIAEFVDAYSRRYPRLAGIRYKLDDD